MSLVSNRHDEHDQDSPSIELAIAGQQVAVITEISPGLPTEPTQAEGGRPAHDLKRFLSITDGPVALYAEDWRSAIRAAGGVIYANDPLKQASAWADLGLEPPVVIPVKDFWTQPPLYHEFLHYVLELNKKHKDNYARGETDPQKDTTIWQVLEQLFSPTASHRGPRLCAMNLASPDTKFKIPERLRRYMRYNDKPPFSINITPEHSIVDVHIDCGNTGITALYGGCIKLWALYPPTDANMSLYGQEDPAKYSFRYLWNKLQGGEFFVTTENDALIIPPGCLHATVTLKGGLTCGIEITTARNLKWAVMVYKADEKRYRVKARDTEAILQPLTVAFDPDEPTSRAAAEEVLCNMGKLFYQNFKNCKAKGSDYKDKPEYVLYKQAASAAEKVGLSLEVCPSCKAHWSRHRGEGCTRKNKNNNSNKRMAATNSPSAQAPKRRKAMC